MTLSVYDHIRRLIEETNDAYDGICSSGVNADFAEFASLALEEFKNVLGNEALTKSELIVLLREGRARHKSLTPGSCWATFLAAYIGNRANNNSRIAPVRETWDRQAVEQA